MVKSVERIYLKDSIYKKIVKDIMDGLIKPGDYLTELSLCERYAVSRTPVREALVKLSYEDFLTQFRKGGYLVKEISYKDLFDLMDIRLVLEVHAAKLAATLMTTETLHILEKDSAFRTLDEWLEMNKEFHVSIARATGNERLAEIVESLLDRSRRLAVLDSTILFPYDEGTEHAAIYQAFRDRDASRAASLMEKHLLASRDRIKDHIAKQLLKM